MRSRSNRQLDFCPFLPRGFAVTRSEVQPTDVSNGRDSGFSDSGCAKGMPCNEPANQRLCSRGTESWPHIWSSKSQTR